MRTVLADIHAGKLAAQKAGKYYDVEPDELDRYYAARAQEKPAPEGDEFEAAMQRADQHRHQGNSMSAPPFDAPTGGDELAAATHGMPLPAPGIGSDSPPAEARAGAEREARPSTRTRAPKRSRTDGPRGDGRPRELCRHVTS
ncbi:hypothetical protein [Sorangium sp. So ce426]|uniref:hypothetical protein n=1 Tax=unclassified Sorangium TaxID=2621164 RepID=UPI003F5BD7D3